MQKYIISFDIDGTILNSNHKVSKNTIDTLKKLQSLGHKLVLNTGRYYQTANLIFDNQFDNIDVIAGNGSHIYFATNTEVTHFEIISKFEVKKIIELLKNRVNLRFTTTKGLVLKETDHYVDLYDLKNNSTMDFFFYQNLEEILNYDVLKISVFSKNRLELESFEKILKKQNLEVCFSDHFLIDLSKINVNKGTSLLKYQNYFEENFKTIAFGDNDNDLQHLTFADISVAMSNATSKILNIANHVTKSNDEDGCAYFLNNFFDL